MASIKFILKTPVKFGSEEISELEVKPTGRALRDFTLPMSEGKVDYQPHVLAVVGLKMSGKLIGADKIADEMTVEDLNGLAKIVMSFFA